MYCDPRQNLYSSNYDVLSGILIVSHTLTVQILLHCEPTMVNYTLRHSKDSRYKAAPTPCIG